MSGQVHRFLAGSSIRLVHAAIFVAAANGCQSDPRNLPPEMPKVKLGAFEAYGEALDEGAGPLQIAKIWAKGVQEFVSANRERDSEKRKRALGVLANVAAPRAITKLRQRPGGAGSKDEETERFVYAAIRDWSAISSHYIEGIQLNRMTRRFSENSGGAKVTNVSSNPDTVPESVEKVLVEAPAVSRDDGSEEVVLLIHMTKEDGYWRVVRVSFKSERKLQIIRETSFPLNRRSEEEE
jgi:hypothetical protein